MFGGMSGDITLITFVLIGVIVTVGVIGALIYKFLIKPRRKVKIGATSVAPAKDSEAIEGDSPGTLLAYVWRPAGITPELIKKPVGTLWFADPSLPVSGPCYLCIVKDDEMVAYDPRVAAIEEDNAPQDLYEAILCPEVQAVYVSISGLWEKIKTLLPYLIAGGLLLIALAMTDNI